MLESHAPEWGRAPAASRRILEALKGLGAGMIIIRNCAAMAIAAALAVAAPAQAQSAYEINRLNQAVQVCNSPMGAGTAECAKLRGQLGGGGGLSGIGDGKAAAAAGLLDLLTAARPSAGRSSAAPPVNPAAGGYLQPGYTPPASNPFGALLPKR